MSLPTTMLGDRVRQRIRQGQTSLREDPMARNSAAIMVATCVTSLLGYLFWLTVARHLGPVASGEGAAATSALQTAVLLASVGSAAALVEWLPRSTSALEWRQRVTVGVVVAMVTATVGGPLMVLVLGQWTDVLPGLAEPAVAILFCLGTVVFAVGTVLDYVLVSERAGGTLLLRAAVMTGLRLPLLFLPLAVNGVGQVVATWAVAGFVSLLVPLIALRRHPEGRTLWPQRGSGRALLRQMAPSFLGQHLITVAAMLAGYLLPIFVVARLQPQDNAYFYVAWMLGSVFSIISPAIATALFAEGAATPTELPRLVRRCLVLTMGLLALPILAYLLGGGVLLSLFGPDYAVAGRGLLIVLTVAALPDAITNIAVAVLRATHRLPEAIGLNVFILSTCLVGSWLLLPRLGIIAIGVCWLGAQLAGVVWIFVRRHSLFASVEPVAVPQ